MTSTSQESTVATPLAVRRAQYWRRSWDEVMNACLPGLGSFEETLIAAAEAALGGAPRDVLDLGGGPGLLAERLAARWPRAEVRLLDLDPVLLLLARTAAPAGVTVHRGDLTGADWPGDVAGGAPVDLVTVVMTIHYLPEDQARALYRRARAVLRPGGVLVVADLMPIDELPSVNPVADEAAAGLAWTRWWERLRAEPIFGPWMRQREALFAGRAPAEFTPAQAWHCEAAREAGFREAGVVWRRGPHAAVCSIA